MNEAVHKIYAPLPATESARPDPAREAWRRQRLRMEAAREKCTPRGVKRRRHWVAFTQMLALFGLSLRLCGLYERGLRNALDIRLRRLELEFESLPAEFDGFRILQLSDLHVDFLEAPLETALDLVSGEPLDLCVLTGDYRKHVSGPFEHILPSFERLLARLRARSSNRESRSCISTIRALSAEARLWSSKQERRTSASISDSLVMPSLAGARRGYGTRPNPRIRTIRSPKDVRVAESYRLLAHFVVFCDAATISGPFGSIRL